jgi:hypothetical protein
MKSGQLLADEAPKFARQLEITYGIENVQRIDNLARAQTRLSNSWTNFVRSLDEDGNIFYLGSTTLGLLSDLVKGTTLLLNHPQQLNKSLCLRQNGYDETLKYYNSLDELNKDDIKKLKIIQRKK